MSNSLANSKRFVNDLHRYTNIINALSESPDKSELKKLVNDLVTKVRKLDELHEELIYNNQSPALGSDFRHEIANIRKNIEDKIKQNDLIKTRFKS